MLKSLLRWSGYTIAAAALLILFYASIVFAGWWVGRADGEEQVKAEVAAETERQIELAQQDIANNNVAMAVNRLEFLEAQSPNDEAVRELSLLITQQAEQTAEPTRPLPAPVVILNEGDQVTTITVESPTATPTPRSTPVPQPTPTKRATPHPENVELQLSEIEADISNERWEDAINNLIAFQLDNPSYERFYTDSLLFDAYVGGGFAFTNSNRVTLGINYFEQGEKLGALPDEAISQLYYSRVYLAAISYYGIDWPRSVNRLDEICRAAPGFPNACDLLYNARTAWGDQLLAQDDNCGATEQYRLALRLSSSGDLLQKFNSAQWKCDNATPTPWSNGG